MNDILETFVDRVVNVVNNEVHLYFNLREFNEF